MTSSSSERELRALRPPSSSPSAASMSRLIEMDHPASGPTGPFFGANARFLSAKRTFASCHRRRRRPCGGFPNSPARRQSIRECGMMWACGGDAAPAWRAAAERISGKDRGSKRLTPDELERHAPGIDIDGIALALWEEAYGYADPYGATQALVKGARQRGAKDPPQHEGRERLVRWG